MIARFNGNVVPFADDATSTNRTVFGGVTQSDAIDDNLNADFKKGWEIVGLNDNPTREDFNAMGYTLGALISYLYQMGIAEWNNKQKYKKYSRVIGSDGKIYKAKEGTDLAPNVNNNPTTDITNTNWDVDNQIINSNITVNVGAGQTYTTINQALEYLSGFSPMYKKSGVTATINLKAGFVMAEQVLVSGIDLGWITIVGEDAETIITHTALTTTFNGGYPAFGVDKGGTSPIIGQLFRFNVEKVGGNKHGLMTWGAGSSASILGGAGFIGAGTVGIYALFTSIVNANGANCSFAGSHGILASGAATVNATNANCSNSGGNGIGVANGSTVNAEGANCSNSGTYGIHSVQGSTINANGANCSNAGTVGIYALFTSIVNANGANCSNSRTYGISAVESSTISANGANCSNAGAVGIHSVQGSIISAYGAIIQNQTTGTARISVNDGSTIEATGINTTGGTVAVFNQAVNTLTSSGIIYQ